MGNRGLTQGEIDMAAAIFGDTIAYGDVRVYDRGAIGLPLSITAPNGNIYYPERFSAYYSDDFSASGVHPLDRGTFMHEMGHVWQHHQGVNVVVERNFNGDYDYSDKLNNDVPFDEWGIEEQAEYLADVYRAQNGYSLGHAVNQTYTLEELLAVDTGIPNLQALVDNSSAPTSSLRPVARPEHCFLEDSSVQMWPLDPSIKPRLDGSYDEELVLSKVWYKRQDQMQAGDLVVSPDKWGRLQPGRVTRTMTNTSTHILDFWDTGVTPGHVYNCADGPFKGGFAPLMDILRMDGALMRSDGTMFRSTTNCDVGSMGDMMIHASATLQKPDGSWTEPKAGKVRFGTRIILPDGQHMSFMEMAASEGWRVSDDGYMVAMRKGEDGTLQEQKFLFPYAHGEELPKPEDYILARSKVSLEAIYAAGEWEQIGTRMPVPAGMVGLNTNYTSTTLQPTKPLPNVPPAFANRPDVPRGSERQMNHKR